MTFLNPFVLFGLIAAGIPVLLHLLNLRKLRTIEFSTLAFLKELQQTKIRRLKLRQMLLLIVRTLLVIFIVFAFARPALRGTILGSIATHAHTTVVLILDDSFSMTASDEHGDLFRQTKEAAGKVIGLLKEGDEAFMVKLSGVPLATVEPATHDFTALKTMVNEARISSVRRPLEDAFRLSARLLAQSKNANQEVYVISDMQGTLFPEARLREDGGSLRLFGENVKFFMIALGAKEQPNAGLDSVEVVTRILEKDRPAVVFSSLRNFSSLPLSAYVMSVFLDGVRTGQSNVNVEPWGSASGRSTVTPKRSGFIKGYVELEHDAVEQDDRRFFVVRIPERLSVAAVSPSPADVRFPLLALGAESAEGRESSMSIAQTTPQRFPMLDLNAVDVLILSNIRSFSGGDVDRIKAFLTRGGGVILFPGKDLQRDDYNAGLFASLGIPPAEGIISAGAGQAAASFQKIDIDHPLFANIFEKDSKGRSLDPSSIESPRVVTSLKVQSGKAGRTVITLSDGSAFLSEHTVGEGRILIFSVAPVLEWSDFPVKGIFAPLIHRSVIYAGSREQVPPSYTAGDQPLITVGARTQPGGANVLTLSAPDGTQELLKSGARTTSGYGLTVALPRLESPGIYQVMSGGVLLAAFAVNADPRESDCRKVRDDQKDALFKTAGIARSSVHELRAGEALESAILQSRFGVELWKYCLLAALILAVTEMLIARDSRKGMEQLLSAAETKRTV